MHTGRYPTGLCWRRDGVGEGPPRAAPRPGRAPSASSARHSNCSANRASTAPAWTSSARWPRCPSARPTSTSPARTSSSPNTCAGSIPTSCPGCSTAPTSRPANDSSLLSRCPRPGPLCPFIAAAVEIHDPQHPGPQYARDYKRAIAARFAETAREAGADNPEQLGEQLALLLDGASARTRVLNADAFPTAAAIAVVLIDNAIPTAAPAEGMAR